jgi:hypothetical protein
MGALDRLLPEPLVRHDGPSSLIAALNSQPAQDRWALHLLHYVPERRGEAFDVIEDVIPLHDLSVSVRVDRAVERVRLAPDGENLAFTQRDGRVVFRIPRLDGHGLAEIAFA